MERILVRRKLVHSQEAYHCELKSSCPIRKWRSATYQEAYHCELKSGKPGVDSEARWVRKGRHYRYGYKKHVLTDEQGLVETVVTTSANCADTVVLPELIKKSKLPGGISVLADKGYCSKENSEYL
ncbi:transposase, partial [Porphyromonas gingivalis]|uniref:transposase n=1 Tax=Porphyromonas gingivalis TaxID=837 RepID=UPI00117CFC03